MDVSALYPSIASTMAAKALKDTMKLSTLEWENLDRDKIAMYMALNCPRADLKNDNLEEVVPTPKLRTTLYSWMKTDGTGVSKNGYRQVFPAKKFLQKHK